MARGEKKGKKKKGWGAAVAGESDGRRRIGDDTTDLHFPRDQICTFFVPRKLIFIMLTARGGERSPVLYYELLNN